MSIITLSSALPSIATQIDKLKSKSLTILYSAGDSLPVELCEEFSKNNINVSYLHVPKGGNSSLYAILGYLIANITEDSVFISGSSVQDYADIVNDLYETFPSIKYRLTVTATPLPLSRQKPLRKVNQIRNDQKNAVKNAPAPVEHISQMMVDPNIAPVKEAAEKPIHEDIKQKSNAYKKVSMQEAESTEIPALRSRVKKNKKPEFDKSFSEFCKYNNVKSIVTKYGAKADDVVIAISDAAKNSSEPIGFQIQLQIRLANKDLSDAIYKKLAPEYKNMKKSLEIEDTKSVVQK